MTSINHEDFVKELTFCIEKEDIVKAKALLQFASDSNADMDLQKRALLELGKASEKIAFPLLEYLTGIEISSTELQESLYDLILDKAYGNTDLVLRFIRGKNKKSRLLFIRAAGDLNLQEAAGVLQEVISSETDTETLKEAVLALGSLRLEEYLPAFSPIINSADLDLKKAAVQSIAAMGGQKAVKMLTAFVTGDETTDKIVVEAIAEIQDIFALDQLAILLRSKKTIVRDTAIDQLIQMGQKAVPVLTKAFQNAQSDYMVHLITTLGYIGDPAAIPAIIDIINTQPKDPNIRQAAFEAMERIPSRKTAICLAQGLTDPVETVRMGAARAIDKNLSKALVAGLKNIVRQEDSESDHAVSALIDSEAENIFGFLLEEESFIRQAKNHVTEKASPRAKERFLDLLRDKGKTELAAEWINALPEEKKGRGPEKEDLAKRIFVIDDSRMMLKLYQNKLTKMGFEPSLFQFPEKALPEILSSKPDLVITDLNMPDISGLELTREIRKKYSRAELPILMITTQSDFLENENGDITVNDTMLQQSGINRIIHKPFTDEIFIRAVSGVLEP
ncbi:MAG: HEAT repeat domain-containing protein [Desulfarculaceae bacterium]|nr:HEAT repeat domain-containing protein [Desulfarculaceae bacterium]